MDLVKFVGVAAVPTDFFAQSSITSRIVIGLMIVVFFTGAWLICPPNETKGE